MREKKKKHIINIIILVFMMLFQSTLQIGNIVSASDTFLENGKNVFELYGDKYIGDTPGIQQYIVRNKFTGAEDIAYCYNIHRDEPEIGGERNNEYIRIPATPAVFIHSADKPRLNSRIPTNQQAKDFMNNVVRVIYNGYPNNASKLQGNLTDSQFRELTQNAIWYYTDSKDIDPRKVYTKDELNVFNRLINEGINPPENTKLDIFFAKDQHNQNLLTARFINKFEYEKVFAKVNLNDQDITGAKLQIIQKYDNKETVLEEWISKAEKKTFKLEPGNYIYREIEAPEEYQKANDINFTVANDGTLTVEGEVQEDNLIKMVDRFKPNLSKSVKFLKTDQNGIGLPEANLKLVIGEYINSTPIKTWQSSSGGDTIDDLIPNQIYTIVETKAPLGYEIASSITFRITSEGKLEIKNKAGIFVEQAKAQVQMEDKYSEEKVSIPVEKRWASIFKLKEVEIYLYQNGQKIQTVKLNEENLWRHTFNDLYKYNQENGQEYRYEVKEKIYPENTSAITMEGENVIITNTYTPQPEKISINVEKEWIGKYNKENEIKVYLVKNGERTSDFIILKEENNWRGSFDNLKIKEQYADVKENEYTVEEENAKEGKVKIQEDEYNVNVEKKDKNYKITNTYIPKEKEIEFSKIAVNGSKELEGATLKVVKGQDDNGEIVAEWISSNVAKTIPLKEGTYTMVETKAPLGYEIASSITFRITSEGKLEIKNKAGIFVEQAKAQVQMEDKLKKVPNTSDDRNLLYLALLFISSTLFIITLTKYLRKN